MRGSTSATVRLLSLSLLCLRGAMQQTNAFLMDKMPRMDMTDATLGNKQLSRRYERRSPINSDWLVPTIMFLEESSEMVTKLKSPSSSLLSAAAMGGSSCIEAELLNNMAHIAFDFTYMSGASEIQTRVATLVGRMLSMISDYLPDHYIKSDVLAFQLALLSVTANELIQSAALPVLLPNRITDYRDRKAYSYLMRPAGIAWSQYKALLSNGILHWVREDAEKVILDENQGKDRYIYWLYKGSVKLKLRSNGKDKVFTEIKRAKMQKGLIGDMSLASCLDSKCLLPEKKRGASNFQTATAVTKEANTMLLKIDKVALAREMESDGDLAQSIRLLLIQSMKDTSNVLMQT